jgi:hypothetical protein
MHSCANFLLTCLILSHTQYYTCTLVRIFLNCLSFSHTQYYTVHALLCEFSFNSSKVYLIHSTIHALLCRFSFNWQFISYTVLYMHSCANFLSTFLSLSHTQYYPSTLVQIFFQLTVYLIHSTIHALLCEFSFNLSQFMSYTVLSMHSCARIFSQLVWVSLIHSPILYMHSCVNFLTIYTHSCAKFSLHLSKVSLIHSTIHALLCKFLFELV